MRTLSALDDQPLAHSSLFVKIGITELHNYFIDFEPTSHSHESGLFTVFIVGVKELKEIFE